MSEEKHLQTKYIKVNLLKKAEYNPRKWSDKAFEDLKKSIENFGLVDPLIVNKAKRREYVVIGGHFRLEVAKKLGIKKVPVVFVNIPDKENERELNLRLNKNTGEWDLDLLADFDEAFLEHVGFDSEFRDEIFDVELEHEAFNLEEELKKLDIDKVKTKSGDVYKLGKHRLMCGDSTKEEDLLKLADGKKFDFSLTDPPYRISYIKGGKRHGKPTEGFGYKKNRKYLETDVIPDDFTKKWMANISKVQKDNFSIICFENWKNLREIWGEMERYWDVRNMIIFNIPNRHQGFAAKHRFFSKYDIAMLATDSVEKLNLDEEPELLQNEYETALYAISGKGAYWEGYESGKKIQPTDHIQFRASDEKHSGQGVVFGTKPVEILIPYIKVLTKRGDLIIEPFGGSGSTLIAAEKMNRRCFVMEKSPVYCEVIIKRWEKLTGKRAKKIT